MISPEKQLCRLLEKVFEDNLQEQHRRQLNQLLREHPELVSAYCEYTALHGALHWDAGTTPLSTALPANGSGVNPKAQRSRRRSTFVTITTILSLLFAAYAGWWVSEQDPQPLPVVEGLPQPIDGDQASSNDSVVAATDDNSQADGLPSNGLKPLDTRVVTPKDSVEQTDVAIATSEQSQVDKPYFAASFTDAHVVSTIDDLLNQSWRDHESKPADRASDSEWIRRAYLVYAGRIPGRTELLEFEQQPAAERRAQLIDKLGRSEEVPQYMADVWTQLMIGRTNRPGVNRNGLQQYLVDRFTSDAPWIDTVTDLITARGRNDRNGATNFLLAHLNNQATPATAVTARLFLGQQISCVQCHDHPFAKGVRQQDYWALNAFFKNTKKVSVPIADTSQKPMKQLPFRLEDRSQGDPMTYFENRSGLNIAVLPTYDGTTLNHDSNENRRKALARLLAADSQRNVARAMVNRMWAHFFGYGFTNPIDDMGPHVPVSHPELLDALTEAFVKSDYSLNRLMKWIALSDAWQRSSLLTEANLADQPDVGDAPLFTRVYPRRMSPEQVYESIRVALQSVGDQPLASRQEHADHRREWVRQFTMAYDTDENDEAMDFEGTISQAMVMMNGPEVNKAIKAAAGALVQNQKGATTRALTFLAESLLTREPTDQERKAFRRYVQQLNRRDPSSSAVLAVEDMLWAYLNSTEFVTVY